MVDVQCLTESIITCLWLDMTKTFVLSAHFFLTTGEGRGAYWNGGAYFKFQAIRAALIRTRLLFRWDANSRIYDTTPYIIAIK